MPKGRSSKYRYGVVDDLDEVDLSTLRSPIKLHGPLIQQVLNSVHYGSPELRGLLWNECDLIFECKTCRALFRDLPNFISHKRVFCKDSARGKNHEFISTLPDEKVVVVEPTAPDESSENKSAISEECIAGRSSNESSTILKTDETDIVIDEATKINNLEDSIKQANSSSFRDLEKSMSEISTHESVSETSTRNDNSLKKPNASTKSRLNEIVSRIQSGELGHSEEYNIFTKAAEKLEKQKEEMSFATIQTTTIPTNPNAMFINVDVDAQNSRNPIDELPTPPAETQGVVTRKRQEKRDPVLSSNTRSPKKDNKLDKHSSELEKMLKEELKEIQKKKESGEIPYRNVTPEKVATETDETSWMSSIDLDKSTEKSSLETGSKDDDYAVVKRRSRHSDLDVDSRKSSLDDTKSDISEDALKAIVKRRKRRPPLHFSPPEKDVSSSRGTSETKISSNRRTAETAISSNRTTESEDVVISSNEQDTKLFCMECSLYFSSRSSLRFHRKIQHTKERVFYSCPFCPSTFYYFFAITRHIRTAHKKSAEEVNRMRKKLRDSAVVKRIESPEKVSNMKYMKNKSNRRIEQASDSALNSSTASECISDLNSTLDCSHNSIDGKERRDSKKVITIFPTDNPNTRQKNENHKTRSLGVLYSCTNCGREFTRKISFENHSHVCSNKNDKQTKKYIPDGSKSEAFNKSPKQKLVNSEEIEKEANLSRARRRLSPANEKEKNYDTMDNDKVLKSRSNTDSLKHSNTETKSAFNVLSEDSDSIFDSSISKDKNISDSSIHDTRSLSSRSPTRNLKSIQEKPQALSTMNQKNSDTKTSKDEISRISVIKNSGKDTKNSQQVVTIVKHVMGKNQTATNKSLLNPPKIFSIQSAEIASIMSKLKERKNSELSGDKSEKKNEQKPTFSLVTKYPNEKIESKLDLENSSVKSGSKITLSDEMNIETAAKMDQLTENASTKKDNKLKADNKLSCSIVSDNNDCMENVDEARGLDIPSSCRNLETKSSTSLIDLTGDESLTDISDKSNEENSAKQSDSENSYEKNLTKPSDSENSNEKNRTKKSDSVNSNEKNLTKKSDSEISNVETRTKKSDSEISKEETKPNLSNFKMPNQTKLKPLPVLALSERPKRKRKVPTRNLHAEEMLSKIHNPVKVLKLEQTAKNEKGQVAKLNSNKKEGANEQKIKEGKTEKPKFKSKARNMNQRIYVARRPNTEQKVECYYVNRVDELMGPDSKSCRKCGEKFTQLFNLRRHIIRRHLRWSRFKCKLCSYKSFDRSECKRHLSRFHHSVINKKSVNTFIIDLTAQGSQARSMKKTQTLRNKRMKNDVSDNIYARPTKKQPRLKRSSLSKDNEQISDSSRNESDSKFKDLKDSKTKLIEFSIESNSPKQSKTDIKRSKHNPDTYVHNKDIPDYSNSNQDPNTTEVEMLRHDIQESTIEDTSEVFKTHPGSVGNRNIFENLDISKTKAKVDLNSSSVSKVSLEKNQIKTLTALKELKDEFAETGKSTGLGLID